MQRVAAKIVRATNREDNAKVEQYTDRKSALEGADFITVTINVGGTKAAYLDNEIPLRHGILQTVGDTVGPGGMMRAFRHVPIMMDIAKVVERFAPEAYIFNYSNPLTPLVRVALRETKAKTYGLCTGIIGFKNGLADYMGVSRDSVELYVGGINHFYWATSLNIQGKPLYPMIEDLIRKGDVPPEGEGAIVAMLYKIFGLMPGPGGRHVVEFLPRVFMNEEAMKQYGIPIFPEGTTSDLKARKPFEDLLTAVATGSRTVDELMKDKGMEEEGIGVVNLMESLVLDKPILFPGINVTNKGCIGNLPPWSVVEVPAYVDSAGIRPLQVGDLPQAIAGVTTQRIMQYEVTIDAALTGDRNLALQALLLDGYVDGVVKAEKLLNEMLEAEKDWLPSYWFK